MVGEEKLELGSDPKMSPLSGPTQLEDCADMGWPRTLTRAQSFLVPTPFGATHPSAPTRTSSLLPRHRPKSLNRGYFTPDAEPLNRHIVYERMNEGSDLLLPTSGVTSASNNARYAAQASLPEAKASLRELALESFVGKSRLWTTTTQSTRSNLQQKFHLKKVPEERSTDVSKGAVESDLLRADSDHVTKPAGTSTPLQAALNMTNILCGSGLLALPYAAKCTNGYVGACGLLALASAGTLFTAKLLGSELKRVLSSQAHCHSFPGFPDLAYYAFGKSGRIAVALALYFDLFLCLVLFLLMGGANISATLDAIRGHPLHPVDDDASLLTALSKQLMTPVGCIWIMTAILLPATTFDDLAALSKFSAVGTIATLALVLVVVVMALCCPDASDKLRLHNRHNSMLDNTSDESSDAQQALSFGLVLFCFAGHALFPSIYFSLEDAGQWDKVVNLSYVIAFGASAVVACAGYALFGDNVSEQISVDVGAVNRLTGAICCTLIAISAISKFALELHPLALGIEEFFDVPKDDKKFDFDESVAWRSQLSRLVSDNRSVMLRVAVLVLALICAILIPAFAIVASLLGAIFATGISLLFPCAVTLIIGKPSRTIRYACFVTIAVGTLVGCLGTWGAWVQAFSRA